MKSLVVVVSYHHKNTEKIANVIAQVLEAQVKTPQQIHPEGLHIFDLIGFGSGIYSAKHHESVLNLADKLSPVTNKKAFIFSTSAMTGEAKVAEDHAPLREKLQSKGYLIVGDFQCVGFNTNSFMKFFGGMNRGRPNAEDLKNAAEFAMNLKQNLQKT